MALLTSTSLAGDRILPDTGPLEKVIVVDVRADMAVGGDDLYTRGHDAISTLATFQGLINRQSSTKILLKNMPVRLFWNVADGGHGNPYDIILEQGMLGVPVEVAELDGTKTFPALDYLLRHYHHLVKGFVYAPAVENFGWKLDYDPDEGGAEIVATVNAARAAAVNVCTFDDALFVTNRIADFIFKREGFYFPELADTRKFKSPEEALDWSLERYIDHPKRNRQVVGFPSARSQNPPHMWDYFVATRTFCFSYFLEKWTPPFDTPRHEHFKKIAKYYPKGTPVFGEVEGSHVISHLQSLGFNMQEGPIPNTSVYSSVGTDVIKFTPAPPGKAVAIKPDGIYLGWNTVDGDAHDINFMAIKGFSQDKQFGAVPFGLRLNPYWVDLFPSALAWFGKLATGQVDIIGSMHDGGMPSDADDAYRAHYAHALEKSNGMIRIVNFFGDVPGDSSDKFHSAMRGLPIDYVINGYWGTEDNSMHWKLLDDRLYSTQVVRFRHGEELVYEHLAAAIKRKKPGEPIFIMAKSPSEFGIRVWTMIVRMNERLAADPEISALGKLHVLRPLDLAATVREQMRKSGVEELRY